MAFLNNPEDQENQNEQQQPVTQPSTMNTPSGGGSVMPQNQASAPKGSGRFTNIQKYIGANQGAGQRLASGVGQRVQSQINPGVQKTESNMESLRQGIQQGQGTLGQGQQFQQQVQDQNFDATGFAQDENNVTKFNQFRTGQALDEAALRKQAQDAQLQAQQAQQTAQQLGQQFGTEQGRQQLLKQTFSPGRNYSIGQQRLDQLFLQQATPEIKNIQGSIAEAQGKLGSFGSQLGTQAQSIEDLVAQEAGLQTGIQSGISAREQDLINAVNATSEQVNKARMTSQDTARQQYQNLLDGKKVNQDFANLLGLKEEDRLFNVLKNDGAIDKYLTFNNTLLTSPDQLATAQDRTKYDAIARLAGIDPSQRAINLNTQVQNAVDSTGKLRSGIDANQAKFQELLDGGARATGRYDMLGAARGHFAEASDTLKNLTDEIDKVDQNGGYQRLVDANPYWLNGRYNAGQFSGDQFVGDLMKDIQSNMVTNSIGLYGGGTASFAPQSYFRPMQASQVQALMDAYRQLADQGYLQNVNIGDEE